MNGASSPPLLYAECASPRETGLFPVHARWCPRGSRKGAWRDFRAARDVSRRTRGPDETAPVIRPSGQDAGPTSPLERRGPRGRRRRWRSRRPSPQGPFTRDAASGGIAARLPLSLVVEAFCAVEAVLALRSRDGRYHSYKQQITFVFPKLNK